MPAITRLRVYRDERHCAWRRHHQIRKDRHRGRHAMTLSRLTVRASLCPAGAGAASGGLRLAAGGCGGVRSVERGCEDREGEGEDARQLLALRRQGRGRGGRCNRRGWWRGRRPRSCWLLWMGLLCGLLLRG
jgi:hypothetical protein